MLRYLAVLAVMLACFTGDVSAVTDQEFQELSNLVRGLASEVVDLKKELKAALDPSGKELVQNTTIEERVSLLEVQVAEIDEDVTGLDEDFTELEGDVNFLFAEQVIQDERLFSLEEENDQTDDELDQIENEIEGLLVTTLELDFRVTELEENGGSDGNSSISKLEERVETLEGTVADHETRITDTEGDIHDLEGVTSDLETRVTAAEENIQGLQMTDISLDVRITALEENGGGGGSQNETIAFHAVLTSYLTIPDETNVRFNEIVLNEGNGYEGATGVFTVPSGGDGLYYFSTYLLVEAGEFAQFDVRLNDDVICSAYTDMNTNGVADAVTSSCSTVVSVEEGDEVKVVLRGSDDNHPLVENTSIYYNGFNGFRI